MKAILLVSLMFLALPATAQEAPQSLLDEINTLMDQGNYQQAYMLGRANLFDYEGDPDFDFAYGLAALESGRPDEAAFIFERMAFNNPNSQRIQLELARAHYLSNNYAAAETLFNEVLATDPAPNVTANIERFLDLIEQAQESRQSRFDWYLGAAVGNDSNINSATDLGVIDTPIGDISLNPSGQSIDNSFMEQLGGVTYTYPLSKSQSIVAQGDLSLRNNFSSDQYDLDVFSGRVGYNHGEGATRYSHSLRYQKVNLDDDGFQQSASLITSLQNTGGDGWSQNLTAAYSFVRYDTGTNPNSNLRDVNQLLLSGGINYTQQRYRHGVNVFYGNDNAQRQAGRNHATEFLGLGVSEQIALNQNHLALLRVSYQQVAHEAIEPIFATTRNGERYTSMLAWIWQATRGLSVRTELSYTKNDSNLALYEYDRFRYQAGVRYQF